MKNKCISFEKLSDLCDNQIDTDEEKKSMLDHIDICPKCGAEFEKLKKTLSFLTDYKNFSFDLTKIKNNTMLTIKKRERKRKLFKIVPLAVAASFLIVFGVTFLFTPAGSEPQILSEKTIDAGISESDKVIDIIRKNKASLVKVTENFIEGEINIASYNKLRRDLGFRKVLAKRNPVQISSNRFNNSNFQEASMGSLSSYGKNSSTSQTEKVRFRVYN